MSDARRPCACGCGRHLPPRPPRAMGRPPEVHPECKWRLHLERAARYRAANRLTIKVRKLAAPEARARGVPVAEVLREWGAVP